MIHIHGNITAICRTFVKIVVIFFIAIPKLYALDTSAKTWGEVNASGQLFNIPNIDYLLDYQARYDNSQSQFQQNVSKVGVGYRYSPSVSFWLGYQYNSYNQLSMSPPENRAWEQVIWNIINHPDFNLISQSQLDERIQTGQTDWNDRFRQKLIIKFPNKLFSVYTPVVSDEVFVNLTRPSWVSTRVIGQNRAFIGVDLPTSKNTYLEIGYLNQYLFEQTSANQMNNILYMTFYINT